MHFVVSERLCPKPRRFRTLQTLFFLKAMTDIQHPAGNTTSFD